MITPGASAKVLLTLFILWTPARPQASAATDSLFRNGLSFYSEGRYEEAADTFEETCDSTTPKVLFYQGMSRLALNDVQKGIPLLGAAVAAEPSNTGYRFQFARANTH